MRPAPHSDEPVGSWQVRSCERVTLTKVVSLEGKGVDGDPVREVSYFYDDDGWLVARRDGWAEARA